MRTFTFIMILFSTGVLLGLIVRFRILVATPTPLDYLLYWTNVGCGLFHIFDFHK